MVACDLVAEGIQPLLFTVLVSAPSRAVVQSAYSEACAIVGFSKTRSENSALMKITCTCTAKAETYLLWGTFIPLLILCVAGRNMIRMEGACWLMADNLSLQGGLFSKLNCDK